MVLLKSMLYQKVTPPFFLESTRQPVLRLKARSSNWRIAMLSFCLPVEGKIRGGVDKLAHDLADGLAGRGHQVTVWSYDPKPKGARYEVRPLPWENLFSHWLGRRLTFGYLGNLLALFPDYRECDVILCHGDSLLLPLKNKPLVRIMCGSALGEALSATSPFRKIFQLGIYIQELLTGFTQKGCVAISANTCKANPLIKNVIPCGTDLTVFHPDLHLKTVEPSILFVGGLTGRKRGGLLLEWFKNKIKPTLPNATLFFVGPEGPAISGVRYFTGLSQRALADLFRRAWIYASPSVYEGFGIPYVEAMASGTPVVATPNPGSKEVLDHGQYGRLPKDHDFPQQVCDLLIDPEERAKLVSRGLSRAYHYSLERMLDSYESLINNLVHSRHSWQ